MTRPKRCRLDRLFPFTAIFKWFKNKCKNNEGNNMSKEDAKAQYKASLEVAVDSGLDAFWAQAQAEVVPGGGGLSQADVDAAVAAQKAADDAKEAGDLQAAQAEADAKMAALQVLLDAAIAQDSVDKGALEALKGSLEQVQSALDAIKALLFPAPPPAPVEA